LPQRVRVLAATRLAWYDALRTHRGRLISAGPSGRECAAFLAPATTLDKLHQRRLLMNEYGVRPGVAERAAHPPQGR
jgi:hypothetical protein